MRTHQGRFMAFGRADLGWSKAVRGNLSFIDIPGNHMSAIELPHSISLARRVGAWKASGE